MFHVSEVPCSMLLVAGAMYDQETKDYPEAVKWWSAAAAQGHAKACVNLGTTGPALELDAPVAT
jgi:TPR repeat protein